MKYFLFVSALCFSLSDAYADQAPWAAEAPEMTKESCEAKGGEWGRRGLLNKEICSLPTPDAGKDCKSTSECKSACIADENAEIGSKATGKCYAQTSTLGTCMKYVENGEVQPALCVD